MKPETGEPSYVDAALRKHYLGDKLKDGEYTGIGIGYLKSGWNQDLRDRKEWRNLKPESWSR